MESVVRLFDPSVTLISASIASPGILALNVQRARSGASANDKSGDQRRPYDRDDSGQRHKQEITQHRPWRRPMALRSKSKMLFDRLNYGVLESEVSSEWSGLGSCAFHDGECPKSVTSVANPPVKPFRKRKHEDLTGYSIVGGRQCVGRDRRCFPLL
jgi:hypothetical protein